MPSTLISSPLHVDPDRITCFTTARAAATQTSQERSDKGSTMWSDMSPSYRQNSLVYEAPTSVPHAHGAVCRPCDDALAILDEPRSIHIACPVHDNHFSSTISRSGKGPHGIWHNLGCLLSPECPTYVLLQRPVRTSHSRTLLSLEPSVEQAGHQISMDGGHGHVVLRASVRSVPPSLAPRCLPATARSSTRSTDSMGSAPPRSVVTSLPDVPCHTRTSASLPACTSPWQATVSKQGSRPLCVPSPA